MSALTITLPALATPAMARPVTRVATVRFMSLSRWSWGDRDEVRCSGGDPARAHSAREGRQAVLAHRQERSRPRLRGVDRAVRGPVPPAGAIPRGAPAPLRRSADYGDD